MYSAVLATQLATVSLESKYVGKQLAFLVLVGTVIKFAETSR